MAIGNDTYAYRRRLPHLSKKGRTYYVTFCTKGRRVLPPPARTLILASCVYDHERIAWIDSVIVMPDHGHLIATPYEESSITILLERIKGATVHRVNRLLRRTGSLWQRESFDRIVRSAEYLQRKRDYLFHNPVRAGLVTRWEDYPWIWFSR
jgi:putative transposase